MRLAILALALSISLPSIAIGQDENPPTPQPSVNFRPGVINSLNRQQTWAGMATHAVDMRLRYAHQQPQDRWERAQRLATLANSGHCAEARQIADQEGDVQMAAQLTRSCNLNPQGQVAEDSGSPRQPGDM